MSNESVWEPVGTEHLNPADAPSLIVIAGEGGVGKSHQVKLLCEDPDYGVKEVYVALSEPHALTTYDTPGLMYRPANNLAAVKALIAEMTDAVAYGKKIPRVLVWDNASATGDAEFQEYKRNPIKSKAGFRDKLAEFGDWGENFVEVMGEFGRSMLPCDVVVLVTTQGRPPELCLPGKVVPKNLVRLTSATFYMEARYRQVPVDDILSTPPGERDLPYRSFGRDASGRYDGNVVERFFITMNNGEVMAKGHHSLNIVEPAVLPDLLRKIHGLDKGATLKGGK